MQIIDADTTARALPFGPLIETLRERFAQGCVSPLRQVHEIGPGLGDTTAMTSLVMAAWVPGQRYGLKCINIAPGNTSRGLPGLHASYLLHDAVTGVPLMLIDGDALTTRRTAAASALAASYLARDDARHLLVLGSGRIARLLPEAYRCVRPIERVSVWARSAKAVDELVATWRAQGFDAQACPSLDDALPRADIVSCATLATAPLVQGRHLAAGSHLDLIGSFTPAMREADDDCFDSARWFVDVDEALRKSGDLIGPLERGVIVPDSLGGTLERLCRGEVPGRCDPQERTVFKSVGCALEDLAAAMLVEATLKETTSTGRSLSASR